MKTCQQTAVSDPELDQKGKDVSGKTNSNKVGGLPNSFVLNSN